MSTARRTALPSRTPSGCADPQRPRRAVLSRGRGVRHAPGVPDIHGGDGFDVLDGKARVLSDTGEDWTEAMLGAARAMLALAQQQRVRLALLTDISAACGSQVIYDGARAGGRHRAGQGVCRRAP